MNDIPKVGLGTFGSDSVSNESIAAAVEYAIKAGWRHIDCASVYGNEDVIGATLKKLFAEGVVKREDLWITSKLWNDKHAEEDVIPSCKKTLSDLGLDYVDLYLVHWPFPNYHPPHCTVDSRSPDAKPYINENFVKTWRKMEELVEMGLVKKIGTSNMTIKKFEQFLPCATIKPYVNELELHPHFQQPELLKYVVDHGMIPIGFCPLGSPGRPERDRTENDTVDMEDPVIVEIAKNHGVHPAAICLKWASALGAIPIPFSTNPRNIDANFKAVMEDPLTKDELEAISKIDKKCRLVKGHVFLWEEANDWEDLWDE